MNNFIEARQRYVLVDKRRIEARAKMLKEIGTVAFCWLTGVAMTTLLLALIQLAFVISH
jgi:hypothetical protein